MIENVSRKIRASLLILLFSVCATVIPEGATYASDSFRNPVLQKAWSLFKLIKNIVTGPGDVAQIKGDSNRDGILDWADFELVKKHRGALVGSAEYDPVMDLNHNGGITSEDVLISRRLILLASDINSNGSFDRGDIDMLKMQNGAAACDAEPYSKADLNHDGVIDKNDMAILTGVIEKWLKENRYRAAQVPASETEQKIDLIGKMNRSDMPEGVSACAEPRMSIPPESREQ